MSFAALVLKNLVRQKIRTSLTVVGIGLGIATVVALGAVVGGLKETAGQILTAFGADFIVAEKGSSDLSFSSVTEEEWARVDALPEVERTIGVHLRISKVGGNPYFVTVGVRPEEIREGDFNLRAGSLLSAGATDEVMLGARGSDKLDADVGDTVEIDDRMFRVVGIYKSDNIWQDSGAAAPLDTVQEIAGKPDIVTFFYVDVKDGVDAKAFADRIEDDFPLLTSVSSVSEYSEVDQGIEIMDALNLAVSALAVGIGAIGVMNTMIMSVYERTREIGILRAVGWSDNRVLRMIVGESLFLCLIAALVGAGAGIMASRAVLLIPAVAALLQPQYTVEIFVRGFVVALLVALAGAAYPAVRALRLVPMEALRHE